MRIKSIPEPRTYKHVIVIKPDKSREFAAFMGFPTNHVSNITVYLDNGQAHDFEVQIK